MSAALICYVQGTRPHSTHTKLESDTAHRRSAQSDRPWRRRRPLATRPAHSPVHPRRAQQQRSAPPAVAAHNLPREGIENRRHARGRCARRARPAGREHTGQSDGRSARPVRRREGGNRTSSTCCEGPAGQTGGQHVRGAWGEGVGGTACREPSGEAVKELLVRLRSRYCPFCRQNGAPHRSCPSSVVSATSSARNPSATTSSTPMGVETCARPTKISSQRYAQNFARGAHGCEPSSRPDLSGSGAVSSSEWCAPRATKAASWQPGTKPHAEARPGFGS